MEIAFCRIDDRLIHGQVATVWSKVTGCNRIMCCSDEVAKDELRKKLLLQVVPPGLKGYVVPVDKLLRRTKILSTTLSKLFSFSQILLMFFVQ